ncbi:MAG TPA: NfeD family protein [Isosphaeraceae bacterium]|jgi:membrane-bound serine protease (ClpP class)|nr:NfeD family protein [Isosphaeraceae bacterium]
MSRPLAPPRAPTLATLVVALGLGVSSARAQGPNPTPTPKPDQPAAGRFFTIPQPIDSAVLESLQAAVDSKIREDAERNSRPVLIFEIRPGQTTSGGVAFDLADYLSTKPKTVAYVPEPLSGFGVLAALACDEIIMNKDASLGPITPEGKDVNPVYADHLKRLAQRKGREPADLLLGMLDPQADLREVVTADLRRHFVLKANLPEFERTHGKVKEDQPAWEAGHPGVLAAAKAREIGLSKLTVEDRSDIINVYRVAGDDPTLGQELNPVWIQIEGPIDSIKESYLKRRVAQAKQEKVNLIFFRINSLGGNDLAADGVADLIAGLKGIKTVAFVDDGALGVATLVALACDEIVFVKGGRMGDVRQILVGRDGQGEDLTENQVHALARKAEDLARANGYPPAVARAMVDADSVLIEAKDTKTGAVVLVGAEELKAEPGRYLEQGTIKQAGNALEVKADEAIALRLTQHVVEDSREFQGIYGLRDRNIRVDGPTWVDALVSYLNNRWMSGLLLFVGMFMLILELKLPGLGLPGILAVLAFLLFFWSRYLSGTADQLEIMLFVVGLICLALELFVFPGFGVFGMSGILLILISVVMASHTFIWPSRASEYREMGQTLAQLTIAIVAVGVGAVILGRYFPSLPLFSRMVLKPEVPGVAEDPVTGKPLPDGEAPPLLFLIGETGRTTTALRPSGKARFGELLVDVTADGFYIDPDSLVEVIEVQGPKVIVRKV